MKIKKSIQKAFLIAAWLVVAGGMFVLLVAANRKQQAQLCKQVSIVLKGTGDKYAVDKSDIIKLLQTASKGQLKNKAVGQLNSAQLEAILKTNRWIEDADIYFDSQDVMHVSVTEKTPVARIFTIDGGSYYIDSAGKQMPLLDKISIRLPVFTNYPQYHLSKAKDSALMAGVKTLAAFINKNSFWSAQIAQVDITEMQTFEAVPAIGRHIIVLGTAEDIDKKFERLFLFYQKVLAKTGFDKYSRLDVQYTNQIIATHKGEGVMVDSVQLQKNIQELLEKNSLQLKEEETDVPVQKPVPPPMDSMNTEPDVVKEITASTVTKRSKVVAAQGGIKMPNRLIEKPANAPKIKEQKKAKAIMPKLKVQ